MRPSQNCPTKAQLRDDDPYVSLGSPTELYSENHTRIALLDLRWSNTHAKGVVLGRIPTCDGGRLHFWRGASFLYEPDASGLGDGRCARHVFEETAHVLTHCVIFWYTNVQNQFCAFGSGLSTILDVVTAQNGFEHGPLNSLYRNHTGFKASWVMLSGMLCKSMALNRSTGCCAVACQRLPHTTESYIIPKPPVT